MTESQQDPVSESQIAVHWREEEYIYPPESFIDQANANDPAIFDRFDEKNFPDCFVEYAETAQLGQEMGHGPGLEQPAVLEVVHRRAAERLLQLRGPAPGGQGGQGRDHLGAGT